MRFFALGILASLAAASLCAWLVVAAGLVPINADATPSALERWLARTAVIAGVERHLKHEQNPRSGEAAVLDGIRVYRSSCEACHGNARGVAEPFARGLYQAPPAFAKSADEALPYGYVNWVVRHGIRLTAMPAFDRSLSQRQIEDVALFIAHMKNLSPNERFAWTGAALRAELRTTLDTIGGFRRCVYLPSPSARPHHFVSEAHATIDGSFILEQFYNRGISEFSVIGFDPAREQLVRIRLQKDGTADIATSDRHSDAVWRDRKGATTTISRRSDGSYEFRSTDAPGSGHCESA